jgi:hypothetical protein
LINRILFERCGLLIDVSLARRLDLMSGLGPTAEILSFAPPKESIQRKGGPDAALITRHIHVLRPPAAKHANRLSCRFVLRSEAFERGCLKVLPGLRRIPAAPLAG